MEIEQKWFDLVNQELEKQHFQAVAITHGMKHDALATLQQRLSTLSAEDFDKKAREEIEKTFGLFDLMYPLHSVKRAEFFAEELKAFSDNLSNNNLEARFSSVGLIVSGQKASYNLSTLEPPTLLEIKKTIAVKLSNGLWNSEAAIVFLSGFFNDTNETIKELFLESDPKFFDQTHFINLQRGTSQLDFVRSLIVKAQEILNSKLLRGMTKSIQHVDCSQYINESVLQTRIQQQRNLEKENAYVESRFEIMRPAVMTINAILESVDVTSVTKVIPNSSPSRTMKEIVHTVFKKFNLEQRGFNWICRSTKDDVGVNVYCSGRLIKTLTYPINHVASILTLYEWSGVTTDDTETAAKVAWRKPGYHLELSELKKWLTTSPFHIPKLKVRLSGTPLLPTDEVVSTLSNELIGYLKTLLNSWPALGLSLSIIENDNTVVKNINFRHIRDRLFVDGINKVENDNEVWSLALVDSFDVVLTTLNIKELLRALRLRYVIRNNCTHGSLVCYTREDIVKDSASVTKYRSLFNVTEFLNNLVDSFDDEGRTPFVLPLKVYTLIYEDFAQWLENQLADAYHADIANDDNTIEVRVDHTLSGVTYCVSLNNVMVTQGTVTKTYFDKALAKGLEWGSHAPKFFVIPTERTYEVIS